MGNILIVDDDETICHVLSDMMSALGHHTKATMDGFEALKLLGKQTFTIVISDIEMPGIDGLSLIKKIKIKSSDIDIISMTGYNSKYSYSDVIKTGASDFIAKPFGIDEIEAKLNRIIRERNIKKELEEKNLELLKLSIHDDLTGLFNRRHFYSKLEEEIDRARRQRRSLFLAMFDLDKFKKFNDTYGHIDGDKLLKNVSEAILISIRKNVDAGFRYGGDEFTIIIPEANLKQTINISERIRHSCRSLEPRPIDISIGLAEIEDEYDINTFVSCADQAMYKAKKSKSKIKIYGKD